MSCEGALLLVDAAQGVEAQTVANLYLALEYDLEMVPVINKIDLPAADVERVKEEIEEDLGLDADDAVLCSAKTGDGIEEVLEAIIQRLPPPAGDPEAPLQALIFDAQYDPYRGVVLLVRVMEGSLRRGQKILLMHTGKEYDVEEVGLLQLKRVKTDELAAGMVGYVIAGVKAVSEIAVGDTITDVEAPADAPLPGYKEAKSVVFSSIYPMSTEEYPELIKALEKLKLNDAALTYEKDSSAALGFGFRCGFLGLLHLEVVQERLRREYDLSLILSAPSVRYRITLTDGQELWVDNPSLYPDPGSIDGAEEPYIKASVMMPERYVGAVMELCRDRRGENTTFSYLAVGRVELTSEMPLAEVIFDFYDRLKSVTQGYGSFDYEMIDYRPTDLVKVDILVNAEVVDALSQLVQSAGASLLRAACRHHPASAVQDRHPGRGRWRHHRPQDHQRLPQGRDRQVLRRRYQPKAQAPRKAEEGQEADEDGGGGGDSAVSLLRRRVPVSTSTSPSAPRCVSTAISR